MLRSAWISLPATLLIVLAAAALLYEPSGQIHEHEARQSAVIGAETEPTSIHGEEIMEPRNP